jgi:hypothetical protein
MKNAWIAVGSPEHWQLAFDQGGIWGLIDSHSPQWNRLERDDLVFCYAKAPISGLVGYGRVTKTFRQDRPLWPPEVQTNSVIWPLRFEFEILNLIPTATWKDARIRLEEVSPQRLQSGFLEIPLDLAAKLRARFVHMLKPEAVHEIGAPEHGTNTTHDDLQKLLVEIGTFQRFIAEKEYPMEKERLDVVWRKVIKSVPTYVFEVQVGGDVYHALGKLKHAHDIWNSRIFLVGDSKNFKDRTDGLLSGTFHEIQSTVQILDIDRLSRLHSVKRELRQLEQDLRLL